MMDSSQASAFDQAVITHLESTDDAAATWAQNALGDSQSMSPTQVAREESVAADPDDQAAVETVGNAYEVIEEAQKIHQQRPVLPEMLATATQPGVEA
jgi:hypothetical protein